MLESLGLDELKKLFEERMKEQTERHDGGNRWIVLTARVRLGMVATIQVASASVVRDGFASRADCCQSAISRLSKRCDA